MKLVKLCSNLTNIVIIPVELTTHFKFNLNCGVRNKLKLKLDLDPEVCRFKRPGDLTFSPMAFIV